MKKIFSLVVTLLVLGGIAYIAFPGVRNMFGNFYEEHLGWTAEARRKDPVGFIDYSIKKFQTNIDRFSEQRGVLVANKTRLDDLTRDHQGKVAFAEKQLEALKASYKEAVGGKGWPVAAAGRNYSEPELKSQVSLLLSQKSQYDANLKQLVAGASDIERSQLELVNRITESKSKLEMLRVQRTMVEVSKITADTEKMLSEVNEVLLANDLFAKKSPVRTVEEMQKDAEKAASQAASPEADKFLNS